ncbi:MAG: DUF2961 domain-containing protein [Proteobacteria bacterium]|nr:DUF2961 domain-containing protein [Pseudomonadota bacterium]
MPTLPRTPMRTYAAMLATLILGAGCAPHTKRPDAPVHAKARQGLAPDRIRTYFLAAPPGVRTRWASAENPTATKGAGGKSNKGAKGDAYVLIAPGEKKVIFNQKGAGIITKIWSANSSQWTPINRRKIKLEMYWDDASTPAVSVPFSDFFGTGLGVMRPFSSALFSSPEGRSFNCFVPMPYRKGARIEITNESDAVLMFYYKIDFLQVPSHADDVLYFHAYWNRNRKTSLGEDFEILPRLTGRGRYLGANIGVIGAEAYRGTWFGEGEVKIYLDGDATYPTLVGTGTEDYIGSGWGQGEFTTRIQGSVLSDRKNDLYAFYRYHTLDPVYFHKDVRVTIQQIGNAQKAALLKMRKQGADIRILWSYVAKDGMQASKRWLDMDNPPALESEEFPAKASTNFYRSDDVSATAYFYLDRPENQLPPLAPVEHRVADLQERVFKHVK